MKSMKEMTYDVIIVGGGIAGLSAAHTLTHLGQTVGLLEASPQLGGRICHFDKSLFKGTTVTDTNKQRVNTSSLSLQGNEESLNPLYSILKRNNIKTKRISSLISETFDTEGHTVSLEELHQSLSPEYNKAQHLLHKAIQHQYSELPVLAQVLDFTQHNIPKPDTSAYWARKFITATITQHTGSSLDELSLLEMMTEDIAGVEQYLMTEGADKLIQAIYQEAQSTHLLTTHLNTSVTKIKQQEDGSVSVTDKKGNIFLGRSVILAVPFAVLKQQKIQFFPELSFEKQTALRNFGVSLYNTVALQFETQFWDHNAHYLFPNGPNIEDWPQYLNQSYFTQEKAPILIAQFFGKAARFGNQSDQVIVEQALTPLKRVYKNKVSPLSSYHISRVDTDPNILGGSLYCSTFNTPEDFLVLQKPEKSCYFAGDYIYAKRHGNVEAAFESGLQVGLEVNAYLKYTQDLKQRMTDSTRPKF